MQWIHGTRIHKSRHRDYIQSIILPSFQHFCETNSPQSTETYFQPFTERVLGSWRNRFERASKYTALEIHTQQVKQCIAIALKCVNPDLKKRPNTLDIIEILNAAERSCRIKNGKDSLVYNKDHQRAVAEVANAAAPVASLPPLAPLPPPHPSFSSAWEPTRRSTAAWHTDHRAPAFAAASPNYMANTTSSRAKERRSQSAPRQNYMANTTRVENGRDRSG